MVRVFRQRLVLAAVATCACLALLAASAGAAGAQEARRVPRRALWVETSANLLQLSSREGIRALVARARAAGIDTLIPEAKNAWGFVIYESEFAPHIRTSPVPRVAYAAPAAWFPRDLDVLGVLIEEAHAAGLRVHAAVNTFGEGLRLTPASPVVGVVERHPEWVGIHVRAGPDGRAEFVRATDVTQVIFVNPSHPGAVAYQLAVLWEIVTRYPVDGIILDRTRYAGMDADYSGLSRAQFEAAIGRPLNRWPDDVVVVGQGGLREGPLFREWAAWRASVIRAYVRSAARLVHQVRPGIPVGMYVSGSFAVMYNRGQFWARPDARLPFAAWSPALSQASLLPELDYLMVGLYYRMVTRWEALRQGQTTLATVIGVGLLARDLTQGTPLVGSLWLDLYRDDRTAAEGAIRAANRLTDGVMVFDHSSVRSRDWWTALNAR